MINSINIAGDIEEVVTALRFAFPEGQLSVLAVREDAVADKPETDSFADSSEPQGVAGTTPAPAEAPRKRGRKPAAPVPAAPVPAAPVPAAPAPAAPAPAAPAPAAPAPAAPAPAEQKPGKPSPAEFKEIVDLARKLRDTRGIEAYRLVLQSVDGGASDAARTINIDRTPRSWEELKARLKAALDGSEDNAI